MPIHNTRNAGSVDPFGHAFRCAVKKFIWTVRFLTKNPINIWLSYGTIAVLNESAAHFASAVATDTEIDRSRTKANER